MVDIEATRISMTDKNYESFIWNVQENKSMVDIQVTRISTEHKSCGKFITECIGKSDQRWRLKPRRDRPHTKVAEKLNAER